MNEPEQNNPEANKNSQVQPSVDAATERVIDKFVSAEDFPSDSATRKPRKDKGIKRGPRKTLGTASGEGQTLVASENGPDVSYVLDKQIVEKTCRTVLTTVDFAVIRKVYKTSRALGADDGPAKDLAQSAALTPAETDTIATLTGIVFEKHGLLTGYAPEILLGVMLGEWGVRVTLVMRQLTVLANEVRKREEKKQEKN